jgi:Zn-dependent M28 family amino/carboxypeptidase
MVADINMDMFLPVIPCKRLMVLGIKESTLGDRMADVARSSEVKPIDDPEPQRNLFVRSDQYNFIVHGVPAIAPVIFAEPGTPDDKIIEKWLQTRYHAPSDDLKQPVTLPAATKYEEMMRSLMVEVANTDAKPEWHEDSFFKRYAKGGEN